MTDRLTRIRERVEAQERLLSQDVEWLMAEVECLRTAVWWEAVMCRDPDPQISTEADRLASMGWSPNENTQGWENRP